MASRCWLGLVAMTSLFACAGDRPLPPPAPTLPPFLASLPSPAPFRYADRLECKVTISTHPSLVGRRFSVDKALSPSALVGSGRPKAMTRLHESQGRAVFQVSGEDPGSVDTVSIDKETGAFVRMWSGWGKDEPPELHAGGERGYCTAVATEP